MDAHGPMVIELENLPARWHRIPERERAKTPALACIQAGAQIKWQSNTIVRAGYLVDHHDIPMAELNRRAMALFTQRFRHRIAETYKQGAYAKMLSEEIGPVLHAAMTALSGHDGESEGQYFEDHQIAPLTGLYPQVRQAWAAERVAAWNHLHPKDDSARLRTFWYVSDDAIHTGKVIRRVRRQVGRYQPAGSGGGGWDEPPDEFWGPYLDVQAVQVLFEVRIDQNASPLIDGARVYPLPKHLYVHPADVSEVDGNGVTAG
jgi:hypothetical protein